MADGVFFVFVHRGLDLDDHAALDQAAIVVRKGVPSATGPWEGEVCQLAPDTAILRVQARDDHDARLRVAAALGAGLERVRPIKDQGAST